MFRALKGLTQSLRGSTIISADNFHTFCRKNPQALAPVHIFQNKLRTMILGKEFWKRQTRNRVEICDGLYIPFDILFKQIKDGRRDRARRPSLLESFQLTNNSKNKTNGDNNLSNNGNNNQNNEIIKKNDEMKKRSSLNCCFPFLSNKFSKTYPENNESDESNSQQSVSVNFTEKKQISNDPSTSILNETETHIPKNRSLVISSGNGSAVESEDIL